MEPQIIVVHDTELAEGKVTLVITNGHIAPANHVEVKVTTDGVMVELWDAEQNCYRNAYMVTFADHFTAETEPLDEDAALEDEPEDMALLPAFPFENLSL